MSLKQCDVKRFIKVCVCVPDGAGGRGQGAHEMGDVVRYVDGERRDLWLNGFHWRFRFGLLALDAGQRGERDLYIGAGKAKRAPVRKTQTHVNTYRHNRACADTNDGSCTSET